jgi:hypothetical protein
MAGTTPGLARKNGSYLASGPVGEGRDGASRSLIVGHADDWQVAGRGSPRRRALVTALRRKRRSVGALDLDKRVAQLHGKRTKQVATMVSVAGLAGLLQRGRRRAKTSGADRLRGAAELVCRRS